MFIDLPAVPPMVEGLPAPVLKAYRALLKKRDNLQIGGEGHAIKHYALEKRQIDGQFDADAAENTKLLTELRLTSKTQCGENNEFTAGHYIGAVSELRNAEIEKLPALQQAVVDGLKSIGFGDNPDLRGGYPREAITRHESIRSQKEKIEYLYSMLEACRQTVRQNEETIARIDEKLARHKKTALAL